MSQLYLESRERSGQSRRGASNSSSHHRPEGLKVVVRNIWATQGRARQFWHVFDSSRVPMVMVDNERRYLAANPPARLLFRLPLAELRERRIDDLTPPHGMSLLEDRWAKLFRDGSVAGPYDVGLLDGSEFKIVYCALANALPGQHLIVFAPAEWPEDELVDGSEPVQYRARGVLSHREREVLSLIAAGADQRQIADELSIAVPTVRTHVRNLLRKLDARNRAHAIALAMQDGLIELPLRTPQARRERCS